MDGINNEFNFVLAFNNKQVKELNPLLRKVVKDIFYDVKDEDIIKSWRNHEKQKTDIFLKINGKMKGISIKMGSRNSVHVEHIREFCEFLSEIGASRKLIKNYLLYHYADGTITGKGKDRQSLEDYKRLHQKDIDELNNFFNKNNIICKAIKRFVIKGNNSNYEIEGIIYGTPNDFLWIKKEDIINIILLNKDKYCSGIHFSSLVCQPFNRCLNNNAKYSYGRFYIQIKWYSLFDDIISSMNCTSFFQS